MKHYRMMERERELTEELHDLERDLQRGTRDLATIGRVEEITDELQELVHMLDDCEG